MKRLFIRIIAFMIIANLIFAGNVSASDTLRATAAKEARDGGTAKDIARELKIATDGGEATGGQITTIIDDRLETSEFIRADKAAYVATGLGPAFWDFIRSVRIKGQVPAQKKNEKLYFDIVAHYASKVDTSVKVELKFGDSRFSYTVPGEENDKTESLEWIRDDINNKINPILAEGISLTEEEDFIAGVFRVVKEKIEAKKYPRNINARAEAALRELLVYVKNNGLLDTRALIVNSSFFARGGAIKALNTIIKGGLLDDGLKFGLYGDGAEGLKKELLEDNNNIVIAGTQQDLIQKLAEKKVNPANIVVVEGEGTSIDILVNSLKKLLNTEGVNKALKEFLRKKSYVLSEKIYEKTSSPSLKTKKFEDLLALFKDANLALVFGANAISENAEAIPLLLKYKIKQLGKGIKIAVWADNEAALERLNPGVEDTADIITSKGLNNALEEVRKLNKNIKNENIVLINSPEDLENIKKEFDFKEISQFEDLIVGKIVNDKIGIKLVKLQTPNVKEKKRNDMFWVIARSVAVGSGQREGAVIDNYRALSKEVAEEFPKEDLNSREAIKRLDEFYPLIVEKEMPLVAASDEAAQLQGEYEKLQREIKEAVAAKEARDGGTQNDIARDLKIATDGGETADVSFLRIVPQNVHEGEGDKDVGLGLTIRQLLALGLESTFLGHTSTRGAYITEQTEKLRATSTPSGSGRFDDVINKRIMILRGFVTREQFEKQNLNSEALFPILIKKGYLTQYWRVNPEFAGLDDDFKASLKSGLFSYNDKQIKQIEAILQQALSTKKKIKEIHLGVGSVRKNIDIREEKDDIEVQLALNLKYITIDDLKEINFNISYEPSPDIDITKLTDEKLIERIQEVHQRIYWWFAQKYGAEEINTIWGKSLKIWFRGSVNKVNANPIMSVKVRTKEDKELPGVHGVVFATSGKNVEGYLGVAHVVQEAAKRDSKEYGIDFQYGILVNLKSITKDDKDRTPRDEYVDQVYAALNDGRFDRNYIIAEIAPPDIELEDWLRLVAKAEAPTAVKEGSALAEMGWRMVKQSALYSNNNLALTDIGVRSTSLSTGHPTVEARFILKSRGGREITITGEAASGASAGNREALFLFDKDFAKKAEKQPDMLTDAMIEDIYGRGVDRKEALRRLKVNNEGKGVEITLWIARNVLVPELTKAIKEGKIDPAQRYSIDGFMREYEKTHGGNERQKLKLTGANTTSFSTAAAKLGAKFNNMTPWEFLAYRPNPKSLEINYESFEVLIPIAVLIEGGEHGGWNTDWQEYMVEVRGDTFEEITLKLKNITFALDKIMQKRGDKIGVGLEAGYLPTVKSNTEPIEMIVQAGKDAGYIPGKDFAIALDLASSEFYREYDGKYYYSYRTEGRNNKQITLTSGKTIGKLVDIQEEGEKTPTRFLLLTSEEQLEWALDICRNPNYFISSVEDFFDQNDLWGNMMLTRALQDKDFIASLPHEFQREDGISHVADDISTSNIEVVRAGIDGGPVTVGSGEEAETLNFEKDTMSDILLKLNQAGTIQEVMELAGYLRSRGRTIDHSHRGKEPSKETIRADVALASTTYPSQRHDRTGAPARVKIKYGTIRKERAIVYDYLMDAYAKIGKKIKETKIKTGYIEAEDTIYPASGGAAFDNLVEGILKKAGEMLKRPNLEISVKKLPNDKVDTVQVIWKFAGVTIRRNFNFDKVAELNKIISILQENNLDLRKETDYKQAIELIEAAVLKEPKELSKTTLDFVKEALLPTMRTELSNSKRIQRIKEEPRVFIVPPNVFAKGGLRDIIRKVSELDDIVNIKFAFYGYKTQKLNDIIGIKDENIISAESLDGLLKEFSNRNIEPANVRALVAPEDKDSDDSAKLKEIGIRQIVIPKITTLAAAKIINELWRGLWDDIGAAEAFSDFFKKMIDDKVILPISEDIQQRILDELKEGVFEFPKELTPTSQVVETIKKATNTEAFKKFIEEFI